MGSHKMDAKEFSELNKSVARIETKVDSQQAILHGQRQEMEKISDAIVTIARLDEHLLRFREEDRDAKQRLWAAMEGHSTRLRAVEETTATIKDTRNIAIAFIIAMSGGVLAFLASFYKDT